MYEVLLSTKLVIPPVRENRVTRPHLIDALNAGLASKLILVSAPAGYGKTTLLSEWAAQCKPDSRIAWLSVDDDENDVRRFLTYLIGAVQMAVPGLGQAIPAMLQPPQPAPVTTILAVLMNEAASLSQSLVIILDDYHLIHAQPVHAALEYLLDHMPASVRLVIATRSDPPLPLPRLRARGQLCELRAADLRFTKDEVNQLVKLLEGADLSGEDVQSLADRTEGWIAGLQLAILALQKPALNSTRGGQNVERISRFIQTFNGSSRHILDYLLEEVFNHQPEEIYNFLLQTSILKRFSAPLCDALLQEQRVETGSVPAHASSQQILEYLERHNLFVVPLDEERHWYRYHHLFVDFLVQRLKEQSQEKMIGLHRLASQWYEEKGFKAEAIEHALAAGEYQHAAQLIEQEARSTLMRSEIGILMGWIEKLPEEELLRHPSICIYHAWTLLIAGKPQEIIQERLGQAGEEAVLSAEATVFRSLIATLLGDAATSLNLSSQALERLPEADLFLRSVAATNRGMAYVLLGNLEAASQAYQEGVQTGEKAGNLLFAIGSLCNLGGIWLVKGQLHRAESIYRQALELATGAQGKRLPIAARALMGLGELRREWNDLQAAESYLLESLTLFMQYGEMGTSVGYLNLARVKQAQGDVQAANEFIDKARQISTRFDISQLSELVVSMAQARLALGQGNLDAAARWALERGLVRDERLSRVETGKEAGQPISYDLHEGEQMLLARIYLNSQQPEQALDTLKPIRQTVEKQGRGRRLIEILILKALALAQIGSAEEISGMTALEALGQALVLAQPEGYVRTFLDEGQPLAALLRQAARQGIAEDYSRRLLSALEADRRLPAASGRDQMASMSSLSEIIEPLSERELEVLYLIAEGLSNREIAQRLYVTLSTVKGHTTNIYSKLMVNSRTQAVAMARELKIITTGQLRT